MSTPAPPTPPPASPTAGPLTPPTPSGGKRVEAKVCGVCGDRALGYNFNAITCESCKAFFRRNALKKKEFRCPFQSNCKVDQITRRFCQKCRLRKCFEIGMKKEWIMSDEEKKQKKRKIEENRARKTVDSKLPPTPTASLQSLQGCSETPKPQAVVVGVIRSDDDAVKVARLDGQTDIHSLPHSTSPSLSRDCSSRETKDPSVLESSSVMGWSDAVQISTGDTSPPRSSPPPHALTLIIKKEVEAAEESWSTPPPNQAQSWLGPGSESETSGGPFWRPETSDGGQGDHRGPGVCVDQIVRPKQLSPEVNECGLSNEAMFWQSEGEPPDHEPHRAPHRTPGICGGGEGRPKHSSSQSNELELTNEAWLQSNEPRDHSFWRSEACVGPSRRPEMHGDSTGRIHKDGDSGIRIHEAGSSDSESSEGPLHPLTSPQGVEKGGRVLPGVSQVSQGRPHPFQANRSSLELPLGRQKWSESSAQQNITSLQSLGVLQGGGLQEKRGGSDATKAAREPLQGGCVHEGWLQREGGSWDSLQKEECLQDGGLQKETVQRERVREGAVQEEMLQTEREDAVQRGETSRGTAMGDGDRKPSLKSAEDRCSGFSIREALNVLQPGCKNDQSSLSISSIMDTAISAEYTSFTLLGDPKPGTLNEAEKVKLAELSEANKGLMAPLSEDYNFKDLNNQSLINIINLTEIAIRRLIKMAKRINAFKSLCQEDQIALLKGGCTEMMILRSVCAYDPDKDSWKIQEDHESFKSIQLKVLKSAPGNVYEEHKRFIHSFRPEWRRDHNIIFLLSAITLFSPQRPNIVHPSAILHEQCSYLYLLKRYLECCYGWCEGRTVYHCLLQRLAHLHLLSENHIRVFLQVNPRQVEPLLIEIFDLKQH